MLALVLIILGSILEAYNIRVAWQYHHLKKPESGIDILPPLIAGVGSMLLPSNFGVRLSLALGFVILHLLVNVIIPMLGGAYVFDPEERLEWADKKGKVLR